LQEYAQDHEGGIFIWGKYLSYGREKPVARGGIEEANAFGGV